MPAKTLSPMKSRVLLLCSDPTLERNMVAALGSETCEVLWSADCCQALDITRTSQVDVLVLDFNIHSREFSQLASKCRFAERGCRTLVLADFLEQVALADETLVDGVLVKPLDPAHVRTAIHGLLGARGRALTASGHPEAAPLTEARPSKREWELTNKRK